LAFRHEHNFLWKYYSLLVTNITCFRLQRGEQSTYYLPLAEVSSEVSMFNTARKKETPGC
jgi:hypothetical protein